MVFRACDDCVGDGQGHEPVLDWLRRLAPRKRRAIGWPGRESALWRRPWAGRSGKKVFDSIMAGLQDALAYVKGDKTRGRGRAA
jgi:hypothetical protein